MSHMSIAQKALPAALSSVTQIVVSGSCAFLLYGIVARSIGISGLGVWSLVFAVSSMVQLANLGLGASIIRDVAEYEASDDRKSTLVAVETTLVSIAVLSIAIVVVALPVAVKYIDFALAGHLSREAKSILPLALSSLLVSVLSGTYQSVLYGAQRIGTRNGILMFDSITFLLMSGFVAPQYGLNGLAWARLLQNCLTLVASVIFTRKHFPELPLIPRKWDRDMFERMFRYAAGMQFISLMVILADPLAKGFLGRFGSAAIVGYYEMANRVAQLIRSLLVAGNQVLIPSFAQLRLVGQEEVTRLYVKSCKIIVALAPPTFSLIAISAPIISILWIGRYEETFVIMLSALAVGWCINTLSAPAYFASMGVGDIRGNIMSHVVMSVINAGCGYVMGATLGTTGVMVALIAALMCSAIVTIAYLHNRYRIHSRDVLDHPSARLLATCIVTVGLCVSVVIAGQWSDGGDAGSGDLRGQREIVMLMVIAACSTMAVIVAAYSVPLVRQIVRAALNATRHR